MKANIGYMEKIGLRPQEVLAVREGIKPMLRTEVSESSVAIIEKFCRENGLQCITESYKMMFTERFEKPVHIAYISGSGENAAEYREAEKENRYGIEKFRGFGELLGYPKCCVDFYFGILERVHSGRLARDVTFPIHTLANTRGKPSFYLNNIFNLDSRVSIQIKEPLERISSYFLISHIPCSYACGKSIEYARQVLDILERESPDFARQILHHIRRPVLFFDDFSWVVFNGDVSGNEIRYRDIICRCPDPGETPGKIEPGGVVRADRGDPGSGVIFDFGGE